MKAAENADKMMRLLRSCREKTRDYRNTCNVLQEKVDTLEMQLFSCKSERKKSIISTKVLKKMLETTRKRGLDKYNRLMKKYTQRD